MEVKPIEVYSDATNYNVIRSPNRMHPAIVVQLDTFMGMYHALTDGRRAIQARELEDAVDALDTLDEMMQSFLDHYERVIRDHGLKMSTERPVFIPPRQDVT